jgi:hypothetical protein
LRAIIDLQLAPNRNAWLMQSDGSYVRSTTDEHAKGSQQALFEWLLHEQPSRTTGRRRRQATRFARRLPAALPVETG